MSEPLLSVQGLGKRWPAFDLQDIRLDLPGGLIMGMVGANGAGKTTLLKALMGLVRPDAGEIRFRGKSIGEWGPDLRQRIAYVPDEPRFVPEVSLQFAKDAYARFFPDWDEARWRGLMADFGLNPAAKGSGLSLGMRTKFALSLALSRRADLLVLDEPTTGLDPVFRRELMQRLAESIQDDSRAILFSTHITSDLEHRVDQVALMQSGRLLLCQDQDQLRESWVLVKGALDLLDAEAIACFAGLKRTPFGFEAIAADGHALRSRFEATALLERPTLEDLVVLMGRGLTHVA